MTSIAVVSLMTWTIIETIMMVYSLNQMHFNGNSKFPSTVLEIINTGKTDLTLADMALDL